MSNTHNTHVRQNQETVLKPLEILELMEIDTESFYNTAWVLKETLNCLPSLHKFDSVGINRVRNKLINHAEKPSSGIAERNFSWKPVIGSQLKTSDNFPDKGFYKNVIDFFSSLTSSLEKVSL